MGKKTKTQKTAQTLTLDSKELEGMRIRKSLIEQIEADYAIHMAEYQQFVHHTLDKHGCSRDEKWNVNLKDGSIEKQS